MNSIGWWLEVILAFGFMVFIHEGGHYLLCRFFSVDVEEFALGFGPILVSRKWGKTLYSVRAFPLGGFCKPKGGDLSGETADKMYETPPEPGDFLFAAWWKRVFIFLAGPGMNYLSAFAILFLLFWCVGEKTPIEDPVLGFVPPQSMADQSGFRKGDKILKVDGQPVTNLYTVLDLVSEKLEKNPKQGVPLSIERKGKALELTFQGDLQKPDAELGLYALIPPIIGSVPFSSPAMKAGLKEGDKVLTVDGKKVSEWMELAFLIHNSKSDEVKMDVSRDGKSYPIILKKIYDGTGKHIGISPIDPQRFDIRKLGFGEAFLSAGRKITSTCGLYLGALWEMVTGKISLKDSIGGPVTIMRLMYQRASLGLIEFCNIVSFISLVLCIMNLLPIPVVDGGQIVLCVVEGLKRKPVSVRIQMAYQQVGFFLLVGLMALAVVMDFWNIYLEKFHNQIH